MRSLCLRPIRCGRAVLMRHSSGVRVLDCRPVFFGPVNRANESNEPPKIHSGARNGKRLPRWLHVRPAWHFSRTLNRFAFKATPPKGRSKKVKDHLSSGMNVVTGIGLGRDQAVLRDFRRMKPSPPRPNPSNQAEADRGTGAGCTPFKTS